MDLSAFLSMPDPTKIKTGTRPRLEHELPLHQLSQDRLVQENVDATAESSGAPSALNKSPLDFDDTNVDVEEEVNQLTIVTNATSQQPSPPPITQAEKPEVAATKKQDSAEPVPESGAPKKTQKKGPPNYTFKVGTSKPAGLESRVPSRPQSVAEDATPIYYAKPKSPPS